MWGVLGQIASSTAVPGENGAWPHLSEAKKARAKPKHPKAPPAKRTSIRGKIVGGIPAAVQEEPQMECSDSDLDSERSGGSDESLYESVAVDGVVAAEPAPELLHSVLGIPGGKPLLDRALALFADIAKASVANSRGDTGLAQKRLAQKRRCRGRPHSSRSKRGGQHSVQQQSG